MFEFYERVSGARMHAAYVRPGGVHQVGEDFLSLFVSYRNHFNVKLGKLGSKYSGIICNA